MAGEKREMLDANVVPTNYKLLLDTNIKTFKYKGTETISVRIVKPTSTITLNSKFIKVTSASVVSGKSSLPAKVFYDKKSDRVTIRIAKKVSGSAKLQIDFLGENQYNMRGFYRSKYMYNGKEGWILTTQFESVYARNAFPCFDQPSMKASFDLSLIIDSKFVALSNTTIKREESAGPRRKKVTFNTTPIMSSYLLYIGVGPFEQVAWKSKDINFRILTVPGQSSHIGLAKEFATTFMDYEQNYFKIKYPLTKMDFIAIPDFQAGAMENWGAITSREIGLLGDKETTPVPFMKYVAKIVSHELAHQWFGDLVTMRWWNDLWLNESFATFIEEKAIDENYPKWKTRTSYIVGDTAIAMADDQLRTTHPIHVNVNNTSEIEEILDTISYQKGSAVLRMFEDYVRPEVFRRGLKIYFTRHAYANAEKEDLWAAIAATGDANAKKLPKVASFWIENSGYPMIYADGPKNGIVKLRQERFTILPYTGKQKSWPIPLHYLTDKGEGFLLMTGKDQEIKVAGAKFIKLNLGQRGFYRSSYSKENLEQLGKAIKSGKLDSLDAWGVISDLIASAKACKVRISDVLTFIERYCMECEYPVNSAIAGYFSGLTFRFYDKGPIYKRAKALEFRFNSKLLKKLGWEKSEDEPPYITSLRSGAISVLGTNGDRDVISRAREMFEQFGGGGKKPDNDLKAAVYRIVAYNGGDSDYARFTSMYKKSPTPADQRAIFAGLGSFRQIEINRKILEFSLSKNVRPQDQTILSSYVSGNPEAKVLILAWTKKNWKKILMMFSENSSLIVDFIENLSSLQTESDLKDVKSFFGSKSNFVSEINRALKNTLESIESNKRFVEYNS